MLLGRKEQRVVRYILIPVVLLAIGIALYYVAGRPLVDMLVSDIEYSVIQGEPYHDNYNDSVDIISDTSDNAASKGDWAAPKAGEQYGMIICDDIGLKAPLYYDDSDDILKKGAGQSVLSYCPGQGGTILIGAHDTTFFAPLENIKTETMLTVETYYGTYTYKVDDMYVVDSSDYEIKDDKEELVLYTCYPFGEVYHERSERQLIICSRVSGPDIGGDSLGQ